MLDLELSSLQGLERCHYSFVSGAKVYKFLVDFIQPVREQRDKHTGSLVLDNTPKNNTPISHK